MVQQIVHAQPRADAQRAGCDAPSRSALAAEAPTSSSALLEPVGVLSEGSAATVTTAVMARALSPPAHAGPSAASVSTTRLPTVADAYLLRLRRARPKAAPRLSPFGVLTASCSTSLYS
jgi:hypothetical protein